MAVGWKYWAHSFIIMKNGEKFYIKEEVEELREKLENGALIIEIWVADFIGTHREHLWKEDILRYGNV